jgi:2-polyprenyl-3-methyl-5-hydroxy-6-metoxy-1,4-benzoquinol methylase
MQQAATFWDKAAEKYAKSPIDDIEAYNYTLGRTRSYLTATDRVLEVGCGTGSTALLLAGNADRIVASDISPKMIEIAKEKAHAQGISNVEFVTADLLDDANDNGPYDVVLALNVLHLVEDTSAAIRRINSLLRPGGTFISKTVCQSDQGAPLKFRLIKIVLPLMQLLGKAPFVKFMEVKELEDLITSHGFEIVESSNSPSPSRYIVAKKT